MSSSTNQGYLCLRLPPNIITPPLPSTSHFPSQQLPQTNLIPPTLILPLRNILRLPLRIPPHRIRLPRQRYLSLKLWILPSSPCMLIQLHVTDSTWSILCPEKRVRRGNTYSPCVALLSFNITHANHEFSAGMGFFVAWMCAAFNWVVVSCSATNVKIFWLYFEGSCFPLVSPTRSDFEGAYVKYCGCDVANILGSLRQISI